MRQSSASFFFSIIIDLLFIWLMKFGESADICYSIEWYKKHNDIERGSVVYEKDIDSK